MLLRKNLLLNKSIRIPAIILVALVFIVFKYYFRFSIEIQQLVLANVNTQNTILSGGIKAVLLFCNYAFDIGSYFLLCYLVTLNKKYAGYLVWFYLAVTLVYFALRIIFKLEWIDNGVFEKAVTKYRNQVFSPMLVIFYIPAYYLYQNMKEAQEKQETV